MVGRTLTRKLLRDLGGSKLALVGLALIQTVGISSFVAFGSCYQILESARERYYREHRIPDLVVDVKRAPRSLLAAARSLPNVRAVRGRVKLHMLVTVPGVALPIAGKAISVPGVRRPVVGDVALRSGTWFSDPHAREVLLNSQFAAAHGLGPGDRIEAVMNDVLQELLVVGTADDPENVYVLPPGGGLAPDPARYALMYAPRGFLEDTASMVGAFDQLVAGVHDNSRGEVDATLDRLERLLEPYGVVQSARIDEQPSVQILRDELSQLRVNAIIFPGIFLGVAMLVMNLLLERLVRQQRGVIGTLRALGYSRVALVLHFCAFGACVGLLGALGGFAMGYPMEVGMISMYKQFFTLPGIAARWVPEYVFMGLAIGVGAGILGALRAAREAATLEPAEAMRAPPPEKGGKVFLEWFPWIWEPLGFRTKLALRTVLRNPLRSSVGVLASFFGTAIMLSSVCMLDSFDFIMDHTFVRTAHHDDALVFREPVGAEVRHEVGNLAGVLRAEGQLLVPAELIAGPRERRVAVTGLAPGDVLATPLDASGQRVVIPAEGLVLSDKLARLLGVRPGQAVTFRPLLGTRQQVRAPVVRTAETFMGLGVWANRAYLSRLLGEQDVASQVVVTFDAGAPRRPFLDAARVRPRVVEVSERRRALQQIEEQITETQTASLFILAFLAGSIAFGSVLNTALVSVSERRREIATLRVIGYTPGQVGAVFSAESGMTNAVGILLGIAGGVGLIYAVATAFDTELFRFPVIVLPSKVLGSAGMMAIFVAAAQGIILVLMRRFEPLEALKVKE